LTAHDVFSIVTKVRWVLISWIFLVSAIAYLDRVNISIAGQAVAREFHLTDVQLGAVFSAFVLGYALFQAPGGRLADRIGARLTLALGVLWWGVFTASITFLNPGLPQLFLLLIAIRFVLGMGEAVVYPASNCIVAEWIPVEERGLANGIIFAGVGFGAGVTSPLVTHLTIGYGWRAPFWVSAAAGVIAGAIWFVIARDRPKQHPWVSQTERTYIESGIRSEDKSHKIAEQLPWMAILSNRPLQLITLSYFSFVYVAYIFFSWFFIYLSRVRGLDLKSSSYYTMLPFFAMSIGSPLGGWISDRLTRTRGERAGRCLLAMGSIALCGIFVAAGAQVSSAALASVVLAGGAGALYLSQSSFWSVSADIGRHSAGAVSGIMNMGGQLGGAVASFLTPVIARSFGWTASFLFAAALCVGGAMAWLFVRVPSESGSAGSPPPVPAPLGDYPRFGEARR
jgi:ACS family glucarate transporter-like MFS transporter